MIDWTDHIQYTMQQNFPKVDARIQPFYAMQEYHLGWRDLHFQPISSNVGKLLRPTLLLLACQAVGGDPQSALPAAAAVQLLHDFTLIHDDIEDDSVSRRGRTTVWKQWGLAQGINTGDGMLAQAHIALARLIKNDVPAATILQAFNLFDHAFLTICEGQFLDIRSEKQINIGEEDYRAMIERKTAALFAASAGLGGLIGGAQASSITALQAFGQHLGTAFQIQDDILGIWGDANTTGKRVADDLWQHKVTLPIIHALAHSYQRAELARLYTQDQLTLHEIQRILDILDASEAREAAESQAISHYQQALYALGHVPIIDAAAAEEARGGLCRLVSKALAPLFIEHKAHATHTL